MNHALKTDPGVFEDVWCGRKLFEIRLNDRNFQPHDQLELLETRSTGAQMAAGDPLDYTGRRITAYVDYVMTGPVYGLADSWVIMSISDMCCTR